MPNNPIEDQLRKQLSQHPTPIDVDALWEQVEPRLPKKNQRAWPFWLVVGLTIYGSLLQLSDVRDTHSQPLATNTTSHTETVATAPATSITTSTLATPVTTTHDNTVNDPTSQSTLVLTSNSTILPAKTNTSGSSVSTSSLPITSSANSENIAQSQPVRSVTAVKPEMEAATTPEENTTKANNTPELAIEGTGVITSHKAGEQEAKPSIKLKDSEEAEKALLTAGTKARDRQEQGVQQLTANNEAKGATMTASTTLEAEHLQTKNNERKVEIKPTLIRSNKSSYWTVEPGAALSLARSSRSGAEDPGSEKALEAISLQGLVGYHRANGLSVRTGLVASHINSILEAEVDRLGTRTEEVVAILIKNTNGIVNEQLGTVELDIVETTTSKFYNSVNSLDIPLLIGYRFSGNKWGLSVEAGPTFNLSSGGEAHRYNGIRFVAVDDNYFRKVLKGQGFLANFGGTYRLTKKTSLAANLRYQSFGNGGFEKPDVNTSSTNYSLFGIQAGYRVRF